MDAVPSLDRKRMFHRVAPTPEIEPQAPIACCTTIADVRLRDGGARLHRSERSSAAT